MTDKNELLKLIPKVDLILEDSRIKSIIDTPYSVIIDSIRYILLDKRKDIISGNLEAINADLIVNDCVKLINKNSSMHLKKVINATGTILHTNLGRACLSQQAIDAVINTSSRYSNLEFDLENGDRGSRYSHVEELICKITGAEAALVVNNNAAAVMLVLSSMCKNKEAIVSRGQLVEIGGSFRIPAVMEQSGAKLVEVGTTNRTHKEDYISAINENTGVVLKVHQSNYRILGFTDEVSLSDIIEIARNSNIPVIEDIGSGLFIDLSKYGLSYEPTVQESIKKGVDIITFSGDKLLGGPQAGIIAGKKEFVDKMKKNQLTRALRIDKMTLAALEATLHIYMDENDAITKIPSLAMMTKNIELIKKDAMKLSRILKNKIKDKAIIKINEDFSQIGGGAMPLEKLKTFVVSIKPKENKVEEIEYKLRLRDIPIIVRVVNDSIIIDVRTLFDDDFKIIVDALYALI